MYQDGFPLREDPFNFQENPAYDTFNIYEPHADFRAMLLFQRFSVTFERAGLSLTQHHSLYFIIIYSIVNSIQLELYRAKASTTLLSVKSL